MWFPWETFKHLCFLWIHLWDNSQPFAAYAKMRAEELVVLLLSIFLSRKMPEESALQWRLGNVSGGKIFALSLHCGSWPSKKWSNYLKLFWDVFLLLLRFGFSGFFRYVFRVTPWVDSLKLVSKPCKRQMPWKTTSHWLGSLVSHLSSYIKGVISQISGNDEITIFIYIINHNKLMWIELRSNFGIFWRTQVISSKIELIE